MTLFQGPQAVATPGSIASYRAWQASAGAVARDFLQKSNEMVTKFALAGSWESARATLGEYIELTTWLGDEIGVTSRLEPPVPCGFGEWKAVGAGNELGVCFAPSARAGEHLEPVKVAQEGCRWE